MTRRLRISIACLLTAITTSFSSLPIAAEESTYDVVVYGGTSAAITAAVAAKQLDKTVVIVSPDKHLGGLSSGGLGWTDSGNKGVIGGLSRQFYQRIWQHYADDAAWKWQAKSEYGNKGQGTPAIDGAERTMWIFEPHVAESVFERWVSEMEIPVLRDEWLDRDQGVKVHEKKIESIKTLSGKTFRGKIFIDATYEGDLMAAAGVSYHVGRESNDTYGEQYNGVQTGVLHHTHHFDVLPRRVDPYVIPGDPTSGVIARVSPDPPGEYGAGDNKVQAYCFRMCLTDHPENRVPFKKPQGYDPKQYELMARIFEAGWRHVFDKFDPIPNHKTDTNNHGPMSTDNIGYNYDYPEATYERRREIIAEHELYQRGWLYFLTTDPRVPADVKEVIGRWGLAKDEFVDNDNWPHQLYIREARRMIGDFVMTENHLLKRQPTPKSVGMGSYTMDSHNVQRYITPEGYVQNEGDIGVSTQGPYEISYDSLVPKRDECENLLVPVCLSSSHIAYGSIRMEPVFMILGHSAARAGCMAIDLKTSVQDVPYEKLAEQLVADGQILQTPPNLVQNRGKSIDVKSLEGVVVDSVNARFEGAWTASTAAAKWVGLNYMHDGDGRNGRSRATFQATLPSPGRYEVRVGFSWSSNRASNVPVSIEHAGGTSVVRIDQRSKPPIDDIAVSVGVFEFANTNATVTISNDETDGHVIADAVQWIPAK